MANTMTPAEFARKHEPDPDISCSARVQAFLLEGALACPKRFFSKRQTAKVAFDMKKLPKSDGDYVRRLSSIISHASRQMLAKHGKEIVVDPVQGCRATVDHADLLQTTHRRKRRRLTNAAESLERTDAAIDARKIPPKLRSELQRTRRAFGKIKAGTRNLPLLPAAGDKKKGG